MHDARENLVGGFANRITKLTKKRAEVGRWAFGQWYVWVSRGGGWQSVKQPQCDLSTHQQCRKLDEDHWEKLGQHVPGALMGWPADSKEHSPAGHSVVFTWGLITRAVFGR